MIRRILATGLAGAFASAAAAALMSRRENGHAARPMNAIAHIYDGGPPRAHDGRNGRNTLLGFAIHTAASVWWAVFYEGRLAMQRRPRPLSTAAALSAIAYGVDYYVVNPRFQPGFERYLSPRGMLAVYAALAGGFAVASVLLRRNGRALVRERQHEREGAALARRARKPELPAQKPRQLAADR